MTEEPYEVKISCTVLCRRGARYARAPGENLCLHGLDNGDIVRRYPLGGIVVELRSRRSGLGEVLACSMFILYLWICFVRGPPHHGERRDNEDGHRWWIPPPAGCREGLPRGFWWLQRLAAAELPI